MSYHAARGFRKSLRNGDVKFGMMCHTGCSQLVEIMGFRGLDYVMIDTEHANGVDIAATLDLIRTADAAGIPAIVRPSHNDPDMIGRALDFGAVGVCIPHILTREDAQSAVAAIKYPPEGIRGMCPHQRATEYCTRAEWEDYWRIANEETVLICLIEDRQAVENIEEVASVPGVDALWVGGGDLGQSLGLGSAFEHPIIVEAQKKGFETARRHGLAALFALPVRNSATRVHEWYERGYRFFLWPDTSVFNEALRDLIGGAREAIK